MCTFLLFLNIPVFQRVLDKYSVQVIPKTDDVVCITCCVWNVEIFYIHDNTSMILKTKMFNVHLLWSFNVIRLHVMCSIAIFSSTKSWNFSMRYFAKNIIHMNFVECFLIMLHHRLILSFAFDEFLCIFTHNFKVC